MKKYIWLLIIFILSISCVTAASNLMDKELVEIDNCYNVTAYVEQIAGNTSKAYFKGCKDIGNNTWTCDCHNTVGEYSVIMQTDKTVIRNERRYKVTLNYVTYELSKNEAKMTVKDYGDEYSITGKNLEQLGLITVEVPIYVNNTVYKDREVKVVEYVNNYTALETTKKDLETTQKMVNDVQSQLKVCIIETTNANENVKVLQTKNHRLVVWLWILIAIIVLGGIAIYYW